MIVDLLCLRCNNKIGEVERKRNVTSVLSRNLCLCCKEISLDRMRERERSADRVTENSIRMKDHNPMFVAATRAKVAATISGKEKSVDEYQTLKKDIVRETKEEQSIRMRLYNPVFIDGVVEKSVSTKKQRILSGEIKYKRGPEHHLWKGNRDFNNSCRRDLYPKWTFLVLSRDNFKCRECGSTENLQVHHIKPLREFISEVKRRHNMKCFSNMSGEELQPLVNEVVNMHRLDDGITLCARCHDVHDPLYFDKDRGK